MERGTILGAASKVVVGLVVFAGLVSESRTNILINGGCDLGSTLPFVSTVEPGATIGPLAPCGGLRVVPFDVTRRGASNAVSFNAGATAAVLQIHAVGGSPPETFTERYVAISASSSERPW